MHASEELKAILARWFASARQGDVDAFVSRFSVEAGALTIGSDEAEWYRSTEVDAIVRAQMQDLGGQLPLHDRQIEAWTEDNVAWAAARVDIDIGEQLIPARATFVLHLEHGDWRIVQYHLSLPVSDEQALGVDLTKSLAAIVDDVTQHRPELRSVTASGDGVVALAFTDIVDSTALNRSLGDEAWLAVLKEHDRVIDTATTQHGGEVVKHIGDGSMLVFPSAVRGLACSVEIRRDIRSAFGNMDPPIRMRIGLHLGEPLRDADDFYGTAVNFAARVSSAAQPDEILVSQVMAFVIGEGGGIDLGSGRDVELKGFPGRHRVYGAREDDH
jgi:class 3 adenylate cyclase